MEDYMSKVISQIHLLDLPPKSQVSAKPNFGRSEIFRRFGVSLQISREKQAKSISEPPKFFGVLVSVQEENQKKS
jgi:hypothetical protein